MTTPNNDRPDFGKQRRKLPPEFKFLAEIPDFKEMADDEIHAWGENYFARVRSKADILKEHGLDAEKLIAQLTASLRDLEKKQREVEKAELKEFHAIADAADAEYELFKHMDSMLKKMLEANPFDPFVEEWKEFLDEWRQHMPKE